MKLARTIAFRLFLLIATLQTVILFFLAYGTISVQQSTLMDQLKTNLVRISDIIARSTRHSMMQNRKEDVHEIIASIGREPGIAGLRIYNKAGTVVFGTSSADVNTTVDRRAEVCVSCHGADGRARPTVEPAMLTRIFSGPDGVRSFGMVTPIRNEPECAGRDCHASPADMSILGVLDVQVSLAQVDRELAAGRNRLIALSVIAALAVGLISGAFIWMVVRRPVKRLMVGMDMVADGKLDHRLTPRTRDEIGQLARRFNDMTEDLAAARKELTEWSRTLEERVNEKTRALERAHRQMVTVEKMASLGNLASSVAHELNNPLEGILTFAKLLSKRISRMNLPPEELKSTVEDLALVADEAQRCGDIVKNLLVFARQKGGSFQPVPVGEIVDRCVRLLRHHAEMRNISIRQEVGNPDLVECDPHQIEQVLIALMMNAIEAMPANPSAGAGGRLDLSATPSGEVMVVRVRDTGTGMSEETLARIFEPFFTTKSEGKGVGLGLAIAYGIIERHRGTIEAESAPGRGTTFTMTLPLKQTTDASRPLAATPQP